MWLHHYHKISRKISSYNHHHDWIVNHHWIVGWNLQMIDNSNDDELFIDPKEAQKERLYHYTINWREASNVTQILSNPSHIHHPLISTSSEQNVSLIHPFIIYKELPLFGHCKIYWLISKSCGFLPIAKFFINFYHRRTHDYHPSQ
jgi:hypothetical protein